MQRMYFGVIIMKILDIIMKMNRCGQIDYMVTPSGNSKKFSVIAQAKYAKNYLPYYMMTMHGEKVRYDSANKD